MAESTAVSTPQSGGSNLGLYIGLGVFALLALGGGGYYFYAQQKKKEAEEKAKADAAAAEAAANSAAAVKVPIKGKDGKPVTDKDGRAILVPVTSIQAGQPVIGVDGKPILDRSGQPVIPSATDVRAATVESKVAEKKAEIAKGVTNDYVRGDTIDKRNENADLKPYSSSASGDLNAKVREVFGLRPIYKKDWTKFPKLYKKQRKKVDDDLNKLASQIEGYARGFLKGMNLALRPDYIGTFGEEIKEYYNNPARLNEGAVEKAGQFLKVVE